MDITARDFFVNTGNTGDMTPAQIVILAGSYAAERARTVKRGNHSLIRFESATTSMFNFGIMLRKFINTTAPNLIDLLFNATADKTSGVLKTNHFESILISPSMYSVLRNELDYLNPAFRHVLLIAAFFMPSDIDLPTIIGIMQCNSSIHDDCKHLITIPDSRSPPDHMETCNVTLCARSLARVVTPTSFAISSYFSWFLLHTVCGEQTRASGYNMHVNIMAIISTRLATSREEIAVNWAAALNGAAYWATQACYVIDTIFKTGNLFLDEKTFSEPDISRHNRICLEITNSLGILLQQFVFSTEFQPYQYNITMTPGECRIFDAQTKIINELSGIGADAAAPTKPNGYYSFVAYALAFLWRVPGSQKSKSVSPTSKLDPLDAIIIQTRLNKTRPNVSQIITCLDTLTFPVSGQIDVPSYAYFVMGPYVAARISMYKYLRFSDETNYENDSILSVFSTCVSSVKGYFDLEWTFSHVVSYIEIALLNGEYVRAIEYINDILESNRDIVFAHSAAILQLRRLKLCATNYAHSNEAWRVFATMYSY